MRNLPRTAVGATEANYPVVVRRCISERCKSFPQVQATPFDELRYAILEGVKRADMGEVFSVISGKDDLPIREVAQ
jgi:hypothetical protein